MKNIVLILLLVCCSACKTTLRDSSANVPVPSRDAMNDLAIYAMSLSDTRYQYGGNSPENGFDCSGFVRYVFQKTTGRLLPRTSHEMSQAGDSLDPDQLLPGDLVFFNTQQQPFSHVGIYVGENRFVHSPSSGKAITIVDMRENYWRSRYDGARRISLIR
jgi:cell wall-associated NlpC family hydrolase